MQLILVQNGGKTWTQKCNCMPFASHLVEFTFKKIAKYFITNGCWLIALNTSAHYKQNKYLLIFYILNIDWLASLFLFKWAISFSASSKSIKFSSDSSSDEIWLQRKATCNKWMNIFLSNRTCDFNEWPSDQWPTCIYGVPFHFWICFSGIFCNMENIHRARFFPRQFLALSHTPSTNVHNLISWH